METNRNERRLDLPAVTSALVDRDPIDVATIGSDQRDISVVSPVLAVSIRSAAIAAPEPIYAAAQFRPQGIGVFAGKGSPSHITTGISSSEGLSNDQGLGAGIAPMPKSVDAGAAGVDQQGTGVAEAMANLMAKRRGVPPRGKPECPA